MISHEGQSYFDRELPSDQHLATTSSAPLESHDDGLVCGYVTTIGQRNDMEDTVSIVVDKDEKYSFFAVYDGHGGIKVAEKCRDKMHKFVAENVEKESNSSKEGGMDWKKVMEKSFQCMEEKIEQDETVEREEMGTKKSEVGSTATVVLVGKEEMVVANCGDSRAVLSRGGVVVPLSRDHKPDRADERKRIEAAGGLVINWNGWRVDGILSTSRSLGDENLRPYVCSEPEVSVFKRSELDELLIIGTDGLFDVVCNEFVCDYAKRCLSGQLRRKKAKEKRRRVSAAATMLTKLEIDKRKKAKEESRVSAAATMLAKVAIAKGSNDNISVIIVKMK